MENLAIGLCVEGSCHKISTWKHLNKIAYERIFYQSDVTSTLDGPNVFKASDASTK